MRWVIPLLTLIQAGLCAEASSSVLESKLQHRLLAPCCYRETLDHHTSEAAAQMKTEIHSMVLAGQSEREIVGFYKSRYGARILAEPEGTVWWVGTMTPLVVLIAGASLLIWLIRKWSQPRTGSEGLLGT